MRYLYVDYFYGTLHKITVRILKNVHIKVCFGKSFNKDIHVIVSVTCKHYKKVLILLSHEWAGWILIAIYLIKKLNKKVFLMASLFFGSKQPVLVATII